MNTADVRRSDVRRQAEDRFTKVIRRDAEVKAFQKQQSDAEATKIARLRALRLAKEAAEPVTPPKRPRAKTAAATLEKV